MEDNRRVKQMLYCIPDEERIHSQPQLSLLPSAGWEMSSSLPGVVCGVKA